MSEQAYKAALERIRILGDGHWLGAVDIARAALDDGVDFTEPNVALERAIREMRESPASRVPQKACLSSGRFGVDYFPDVRSNEALEVAGTGYERRSVAPRQSLTGDGAFSLPDYEWEVGDATDWGDVRSMFVIDDDERVVWGWNFDQTFDMSQPKAALQTAGILVS